MSEQLPEQPWTAEILETPQGYAYRFRHRLANSSWMDFRLDEYVGGESLEEVEEVASGYIKWDGCMEIELNKHMCGFYEASWIGHAIEHIYDTAQRLMPGFDAELAGYPPEKEAQS